VACNSSLHFCALLGERAHRVFHLAQQDDAAAALCPPLCSLAIRFFCAERSRRHSANEHSSSSSLRRCGIFQKPASRWTAFAKPSTHPASDHYCSLGRKRECWTRPLQLQACAFHQCALLIISLRQTLLNQLNRFFPWDGPQYPIPKDKRSRHRA